MSQFSPHSESWNEHEHVTEPVKAQARRLVEEVGSAELAKQAVDAVGDGSPSASTPSPTADPKEHLARQLGFISYLDLFEASTPIRSADQKNWLITATQNGGWVTWNEQDLVPGGKYDSMEGAIASIAGGAGPGT